MIDNNLADLALAGDFTLQGTLAKPILFGHADVVKGNIYFQNGKYLIERGSIDFQNPNHINPIIDVTGSTNIGGYEIELSVTGPMNKIRFNYASTPPLSDLDILSLLTTGRISEGRERARDFAGIGAASFLSDQVMSGFASDSGKIFGFDRFRIDPRLTGEQSKPTAWITAGKRITRDLSVTSSLNITTARENIILVEYQLTPNIYLVGTKDKDGNGGLDVRYRLSY